QKLIMLPELRLSIDRLLVNPSPPAETRLGQAQWEIVLAGSVIATVPMIILFFLAQRHFVEGIATTGRKG
ncbi:hypothetical protein ABZ071_24780, partial [Micromonospora fulviviridis]